MNMCECMLSVCVGGGICVYECVGLCVYVNVCVLCVCECACVSVRVCVCM